MLKSNINITLKWNGEGMMATNPWTGEVEVFYWPRNMYESKVYRGLMGTVSDVRKRGGWDWAIELFLGTIWRYSKGDFDLFVENLFETWLEEWLHMIYRWEGASCRDEEKPVREWINMLTWASPRLKPGASSV